MELSDGDMQQVYQLIDKDGNGTVDKAEMAQFLNLLIILQENAKAEEGKKKEEKKAERQARRMAKLREHYKQELGRKMAAKFRAMNTKKKIE